MTTDALIAVVGVMDSSIVEKRTGIVLETDAAVEVAAVATIIMIIIINPHHHRTSTRTNSFALMLNYSTGRKDSSFPKKDINSCMRFIIINCWLGIHFTVVIIILSRNG